MEALKAYFEHRGEFDFAELLRDIEMPMIYNVGALGVSAPKPLATTLRKQDHGIQRSYLNPKSLKRDS